MNNVKVVAVSLVLAVAAMLCIASVLAFTIDLQAKHVADIAHNLAVNNSQ